MMRRLRNWTGWGLRGGLSLSGGLALAMGCGDDGDKGADTGLADTSGDAAAEVGDATPDVAMTTWGCLPGPQYPPPAGATLDFPLRVIGAVGGAGVEAMSVKVCPGSDLTCPSPVDQKTTDADGRATVSLPMGTSGFSGFAILSHPDYVETIAMANVPIVLQRTDPVNLDVIKTAELEAITSALGGADPTRGHLLVGTWDCLLRPAAGVQVALTGGDADTKGFYVIGSLPDTSATQTGERGGAGFLNVPVGSASVANVRASDGAAVSTATVPIVAGKITQVVTVPN